MTRKSDERTVYILQRIGCKEFPTWSQGERPSNQKRVFYSELARFDDKREALAVLKYEIKKSGTAHRLITQKAWEQQADSVDDGLPGQPYKRVVKATSAKRNPDIITQATPRKRRAKRPPTRATGAVTHTIETPARATRARPSVFNWFKEAIKGI